METKHIAIIGSGFGGLGAAIRLAARGHRVEIFESRDKPGGRAYVYEKNGFKFDGGPTVLTAPFMFDDIWKAAGRNREDYVKFVPVSPFYRIFNADGIKFDYNADLDFTLGQIEKISPEDKEGYLRFLATTKPIFDKGFVELADKPFLTIGDMLKVAPDLIKLQSYKSVYAYVSQFMKNDFLRQIFSFHPLLVGGNPYDTASIYAMIHYLEREWGVHYAIGGTGAIVDAMVKLFEELGGKLHLSQPIASLGVASRKITGLQTQNGDFHPFDIVVSNADVANTYMKMIPSLYRKKNKDWRLKRMKYSMSLFVFYFEIIFLQANAQKLNFQKDSFDVVINVESSHRYSQKDIFLDEVYRVLKPNGFFLFADFGNEIEIEKLNTQFEKSNFQLVKFENITDNVIEALKLATPSREELIKKLLPKFLQNLGRNFAATAGSATYNFFLTKKFEYVFYVLKK